MKNSVIEIIRDRLMANPELNVEYLSIKKKMKEQDILFEVLFDFLKELPKDFDANDTTLTEACEIIQNFMQKHGLDDD